jgi:hypothetical protein
VATRWPSLTYGVARISGSINFNFYFNKYKSSTATAYRDLKISGIFIIQMNKYTFEIIKPVVEKNIIFIYFINMAAAKRR